jgi:hypothetical protein
MSKVTVNGIPSYEIISENDYKQVEVLGLLPTDRDPSAWLRMVARVFAAYKGVDVTKSVSAYIDGLHILNDEDNIVNYDPAYYTFIIEEGACFIDDQFIGFKDNVLVKFPKLQFLPGHEYWLVLQYNWLMQADYPMAHFEVIPPDLFNDSEMLKVRGFKINNDGSFQLLPDDLDDQFAQNFHKILNLAAEKVMDSVESVRFQYLNYDPEENKIDPSCKSGDFVYMDYVSGKYKPARSCTKRLDKAVGLYLKDITNNKDYIIHSGFVDFSNPRWNIHPDRIYLKNLEPGAEYYLADNCIIKDTVNPFYDDELQMQSVDPGKISTKFYPGLVRVGYAVAHDQMYIQLDYTSEIDVQNILELFGDKERFDIRYQDYYRYYALLEDQQFIIDYLTKTNDTMATLTDEIEDIQDEISSTETTFVDNYVVYTAKDDSLNNKINAFDNKDNYEKSLLRYSYNIQNNMMNNLYNENLFKFISDIAYNVRVELEGYVSGVFDTNSSDSSNIINSNKKSNFDNSGSTSNPDGNYLKVSLNNVYSDVDNLTKTIKFFDLLLKDENKINAPDFGASNLDSLTTKIKEYKNHSINTSSFIDYLNGLYNKTDSGEETGYLVKIRKKLYEYLTDLQIDFKPVIYYIYDTSNYSNFTFTYTMNKFEHTYYEITNSFTTDEIFTRDTNNTEYEAYPSDDYYSLKSGTDYTENSTTNSLSGTYTASDDIYNYFKIEGYSDLREYYEKTIMKSLKVLALVEMVIEIIKNLKEKLLEYINTEGIIDSVSAFEDNINNSISEIKTKTNEFLDSYRDVLNTAIKLENLRNQNDFLNKILNKLNSDYDDYNALLLQIQNDITNLKNALGKDLDFNIPTKSIFMISNYQRIIYNYTYITNRLKIKYKELKVVNDRIEIAHKARTKVQSKVPVNENLLEQLNYIIDSYTALKNEIENEIKSLTDEYNKIRTSYLGLEPIAHNDPNFDDGGYAVFDLDCLDTVE